MTLKLQMNNMKIDIKKTSSHPSRKGDKLILKQNNNRVTSQIIANTQNDLYNNMIRYS